MLNIYINTWGNYNENGADGGEWITLPMDEAELHEKMKQVSEAMGDNDPEWFVNDYEWTLDFEPFEVCEMENFDDLNERAQELDSLDSDECEALAAIIEVHTNDFNEALEIVSRGRYQFYKGYDLTDLAYELVEECYFTKDTPEIFTRYFNYEAFGRDLQYDGYHEVNGGVLYVE